MDNLPGVEIVEQELVKPLVRFEPFRRCWNAIRPRIAEVAPIMWRVHPVAGSKGQIRGGRSTGWVILLSERPRAKLDHANTVCHELMHAALDVEGWPRAVPSTEAYIEFAGLLNELLDVEINRRMMGYGFPVDPAATLRATARQMGGPQHRALLAALSAADLSTPAGMAGQMRHMAAAHPSGAIAIIVGE